MADYSIRHQGAAKMLRKVPEITLVFWLLKLLTTAMGEAASDFMVANYNQYLAVFVGALALAAALIIQLRSKRYVAWKYWLAVSMVAVFGTMAADGLHIQFHVPYIASTIAYAVILAVIFVIWQKTEKTLSIHSIYTSRRELFYWATILATFALGTAAGDLTATTFRLGYFSAGLLFIGLIIIPAILFLAFKANDIFTFWFAYVITRPLGASFADWTSKSRAIGGLNYGDGHVAIALSLVIIVVVIFLSITKIDTKKTNLVFTD